ncbi:MAG TPA: D-alanine--D-alanine ligase family protein [Candidatus Saccharimonadales bacterium]|nr:D-alanine--D-alanine ligase family protein [Candidatus Saccharimonadales bacterium]
MRTRVLLLFGGQSSEHEVSLAGAANVFAALDDQKYDISLGYIDKSGKWYLVPDIDPDHTNCPQLVPVLGTSRFVTMPEGTILQADVILPILHGKNGEDGTVQGLAKLLHVPMVGPSILGASLTMDKALTKTVLMATDVPVIDGVTWLTADEKPDYGELVARLGEVLFVKPANAGSSVGVSKVSMADEFAAALTLAAEHDDKVLIERAIIGREVEVAVLGNGQPSTSQPGEIKANADFYNYDAKYDPSSQAEIIVPAELDEATTKRLRELSSRAYRATAGHGMARVDFLIDEQGQAYVMEINSIPGFTNISMYPKLWRERGMSYPALLDKLIELALE